KETVRLRARHQRCDLRAAARLPEQHHVRWIAAEPFDVVAHPFEREHEVEHAGVTGVRILGASKAAEREITECSETMVERDDDDIAALAQMRAVVERTRA